MTSPHHKEPNYMAVFWWLLALTIIEVGVIYLPMAKIVINILLVGLALSKACLVAMYFMHLRFEKRTLSVIALTPVFLCVLLLFALFPDHVAISHQTQTPPRQTVTPR